MLDAQVLVIGAGPVGAAAASFLATEGIDVLCLEAAETCGTDMRASTFHAPTLEMLDALQITDELIGAGLKAPVYQYRIRLTGEILEFDLSELADELRYPFRLQCEQYKLSRRLAVLLSTHPHADLRFRHRLIQFVQHHDRVAVTVETPAGLKELSTRYLIAADGASSTVRKQLGVKFTGFTWAERFLTLSTTLPLEECFERLCYVNYVSDPDEWYVLLRAPSSWRLLVPVHEEDSDEYAVSEDNKTRIFDALLGNGTAVETSHRTLYRVHQRVAERFDHGRILLAGDAAHLNNPLGGFGMNSGIHDAWNLAGKLVRILKEDADAPALLAHYNRQRRTIMQEFIQAQTIRNKRMIEGGLEAAQRQEWDEMRRLCGDTALRRAFLLRQSMVQSKLDEARIE